MNEASPTPSGSPSPEAAGPGERHCGSRSHRRGGFGRLFLAALLGGLVAFGAGKAFGRSWHDTDPARLQERGEKHLRKALSRIDASAEQKDRIAVIFRGAFEELRPLREKGLAARKSALELLSRPTIDRAAIEALRAEQIQLADQVSRRLSAALAETAEVLTPEQRTRVMERLQKRMSRWS